MRLRESRIDCGCGSPEGSGPDGPVDRRGVNAEDPCRLVHRVKGRFLHRYLRPVQSVAAKDANRSARGVAAIVLLAFLVRGQGELGGLAQVSVGLWVAAG